MSRAGHLRKGDSTSLIARTRSWRNIQGQCMLKCMASPLDNGGISAQFLRGVVLYWKQGMEVNWVD
jgi:hypothetical protein